MLAEVMCLFAFVTIAVCDDGQKSGPEVVRKHGYAKQYGYGYSSRHNPGLGYGYGFRHGHLYEHGYGPRYGPVYDPEYGPGYGHGHGYGHEYGPGYGHGHGYRYGHGYGYGPGYGHGLRYAHGHGYRYRHGYGHRQADYYAYPRYNFGYKVVDHHTGDIKEQQEHRHGDVVRGYYALHQPDGAQRTVRYYADDHVGFQADVKYSIRHLYPNYVT